MGRYVRYNPRKLLEGLNETIENIRSGKSRQDLGKASMMVDLVREGRSYEEISVQVGLSEQTVKYYLHPEYLPKFLKGRRDYARANYQKRKNDPDWKDNRPLIREGTRKRHC